MTVVLLDGSVALRQSYAIKPVLLDVHTILTLFEDHHVCDKLVITTISENQSIVTTTVNGHDC